MKNLFCALLLALTPCIVHGVINFQADELVSVDGKLDVTLNVSFAYTLGNGTRYSPQFNGGPIGPTLRVRPGDTLTVTLINSLPPSPPRDRELFDYIMDPQNEADDLTNVTVVYNRLSEIGNVYTPVHGWWGFSYVNLHFHGAGFSPKAEDMQHPLDGGESKTYTFQISEDHPPGLVWYHSHFHSLGTYEMCSGLFGAMVIEGTANDITQVPEIGNATEVIMIMSEAHLDPETGVPTPFFPIAMSFDWPSVVNGFLAEETIYEFTQGEAVLFRSISASVEPVLNLFWGGEGGPDMWIVAEDGFPVPTLQPTQRVAVDPGARVEFMVKFDKPGTYELRRERWSPGGIRGRETCTMAFGIIASETCISYDVEKLIATIVVKAPEEDLEDAEVAASRSGLPMELPTALPDYHQRYKDMENAPIVRKRTIELTQDSEFPLFQIPHNGPWVPPGVAFGINGRLLTPHYRHGHIQAGTCEEWDVVSNPNQFEHSFHIHTNPYLVTHENGQAVDIPFWRDTYSHFGDNMTIKTCFNRLQPGDYVYVHCHAMAHLDIGMAAMFDVVGEDYVSEDEAEAGSHDDHDHEEEIDSSAAFGMAMAPFLVLLVLGSFF